MEEARLDMFRNRLLKVSRHLGKQARRMGVTCYRLYDHDLPEFPFCIDRYEDRLYVAEYKRRHGMDEEQHFNWLERSMQVMSEVLEIPVDRIFSKLRQRKPGRKGQYQKTTQEVGDFFQVTEQGLQFWINLTDYLDTGLFLDHRETRRIVREQSQHKRVLNLFAYTGSFSVYAAAGNASKVTTVDMSKTYLDWAHRNMLLNGYEGEAYQFIQADVMSYLPTVKEDSYDLVVMDPPTFSNSKRMEDVLDIQRDHVKLIRQCMRILTKGGILYFSTNYTRFEIDQLALKDYQIQDITRSTTPFDFAGRLRRFCFCITK